MPGYRSEIVLLSSVSFLGAGGYLAIWTISKMGYIGAHPLPPVSQLFPQLPAPEGMCVSPAVMISALTARWLLSGVTSPFTTATVLNGGFAGISPPRVGIIWSVLVTLVNAVAATVWIALLALPA